MKKTTLMIAAVFFTCTMFSQTNTATGTNENGTQNTTNQSNQNQNNQNNKGNQNNQNNNPQQNPPGQNNNVNKSDWNNQSGQSGADKQNTQNNMGQNQNINQSDYNGTGGGAPPSVVTNRFTTDYPGMKANWSRDHMNNYRAEYKDGASNSNRSVTYDKDGTVISRDMELGDNDYPTGINDYFSKNNLKDKHSVWSSEDKDGNKIYYSNYNNDTYWFDKGGKYQRKSGKNAGGTNNNTNTNKNKDNNKKGTDNTAPKKDKSTNKELKKNP